MHIASPGLGIFGANGIVAAGMPLAAGAALASKLQGSGRVAVAFFGDGASNQGTFHESINLASVLDLPVVFVCENNQFGVGTRFTEASRQPDVAKRAIAYNVPGSIVDGMNVVSVYEAAVEAIDRARGGLGPSLIELKTWRFRAHFEGEPASYRTKEEEQQWISRDPIQIARKEFGKLNFMNETEAAGIEESVNAEIEEAVTFARKSELPKPEDALLDVFA